MKTVILTCLCSIALAWPAFGQSPTPAPSASGTAVASASAGASISPAVSATPEDEDSIERSVSKKLRRHFSVTRSSPSHRDRSDHDFDVDDGALMAIPIVGIIFSTLFGAPVLIVAAIMLFSYLRSRSLHRTVREMVEKGQPVPPTLFAPPPAVRARSDVRRGIVLCMVGIGMMI